jgi:Tfp pilus assembly protein PilF
MNPRVATRVHILAIICLAAMTDTGAQTNAWRQCLDGTSPQAIEVCSSIIFLDPTNDGAFVNRGIAYRWVGDLTSAIRDYDEAIRLNPKAADAFNNRGNAYRAFTDFDRALRDYDEAIRLNPAYAQAFNNRGVIFLEIGQPDAATTDFDRAIAHDPHYANAFRNRGLARTDQRQFDLAIDDFDRAFALDSAVGHGAEYAVALFARGLVRQRNGDPRGSADLEEAQRLLPAVAEMMDEEGVR